MTHGGHCRTLRALAPVWVAVCLAAPAPAHEPPGAVLRVPHLDVPPVIDGSLQDWDVPPLVQTGQFTDLVDGASIDEQDFAVRVWLGWNDGENRLYIAAETTDDIHQVDRAPGTAATRIFLDDDMEVFVDADHSGGQYADFSDLSPEEQFERNGTEAHHFVLAGPHEDGDEMVLFSAAGWYAEEDGRYTTSRIEFDGSPGGPGRTRYEMSLVPFDRINITADFLSTRRDLAPGSVIGFNLEFNDFDEHSDLFDAKWSLTGAFNAHRLSERFLDLLLLEPESATAVQDVTWGRIKASFQP